MAGTFYERLKRRGKRFFRGVGDILADSRNMGRLSTGVGIASLPVVLVNPLLYIAIATISLGVFCTSIYLRNRKENYGADIGMLTRAAPGRSTFKGVSLAKLKIKQEKLKFLGLAIEGDNINVTVPDKLEQLGIDPENITLKVKDEIDINGNPYIAQYIHFRTKHGFKAKAKIIPEGEVNDQEETDSQDQASKIGELAEKLDVLRQEVEKLRSANNILAQGLRRQDPLAVGAELRGDTVQLRADWNCHQERLGGHAFVLNDMAAGFLNPSNAAQMDETPVLVTTGTQTSRSRLSDLKNGFWGNNKQGPRIPKIKRDPRSSVGT